MHAEPNAPAELPEQDEPAVAPGDDSNDDPTPPLPVDPSGTPQRNPAVDRAANDEATLSLLSEEPALSHELDIPSDGRDLEGERLIRELPNPLEAFPAVHPGRD